MKIDFVTAVKLGWVSKELSCDGDQLLDEHPCLKAVVESSCCDFEKAKQLKEALGFGYDCLVEDASFRMFDHFNDDGSYRSVIKDTLDKVYKGGISFGGKPVQLGIDLSNVALNNASLLIFKQTMIAFWNNLNETVYPEITSSVIHSDGSVDASLYLSNLQSRCRTIYFADLMFLTGVLSAETHAKRFSKCICAVDGNVVSNGCLSRLIEGELPVNCDMDIVDCFQEVIVHVLNKLYTEHFDLFVKFKEKWNLCSEPEEVVYTVFSVMSLYVYALQQGDGGLIIDSGYDFVGQWVMLFVAVLFECQPLDYDDYMPEFVCADDSDEDFDDEDFDDEDFDDEDFDDEDSDDYEEEDE